MREGLNTCRVILIGRDSVEERTMFSYTDAMNKKWYEKYETARIINLKAQAKNYIKMKSASLITLLISILIIGVLIIPLSTGTISTSMFMGLVAASIDLVEMMSKQLTAVARELARNREYLKDLSQFSRLSETEGALDLPDGEIHQFQDVSIEFINVSFKYPGTEKYVLKNLSMKLEPFKHYAFVGVNGAGKTTITKLLTGMYDNFEGEILIGGKSIREYTMSQLKGLFSVVYQDFARYNITLKDNIALGDILKMGDNILDSKINEAIKTWNLVTLQKIFHMVWY